MDFSLTDEQRAIQETARDFARQEVDPIVDEIDESQHFPREVMLKAGELGFLGILFPEEYGGAGLGYVEYVLVVTELSRIDPSVGISVAAHNSLCSNHIYKFGNDAQRRRWLTPLASGKKIGAWSLTEPGAGSDAAGTRTRAERAAGGWVLNGSKTFTTHGREGDVCVVFAVTDPGGPRHHNISAFVLERGMQGFRAGKKENKLGIRASDTSEVIMEDCFVGEDHLLGDLGEGFIQALQILDGGRISIAALGLGTAKGALDAARGYAKQRHQFGQAIAGFQAIRFMIAEMATSIAAAEALTFAAAEAMDRGRPVSRLASQAKLCAGESAVFCAERGVQIHGGYGFVKDYRAEKYYRDAKICTIGEGTSEIQRLVIARQLLTRASAPARRRGPGADSAAIAASAASAGSAAGADGAASADGAAGAGSGGEAGQLGGGEAAGQARQATLQPLQTAR
ncbi:MAG: acyl-CoA dehydrogenase family protein [Acidobacteria bacterium]|nr:acyl-CoA dehydrogenase family protein [Acidobacteriota bacterium]